MARARQVQTPPPPPIRPPEHLLAPRVEDFVRAAQEPIGGDLSPLYRRPEEDDLAWAYRQTADASYRVALRVFQAKHRGQHLDMTVAERRRWLLGTGPVWRDREAFLAEVRS